MPNTGPFGDHSVEHENGSQTRDLETDVRVLDDAQLVGVFVRRLVVSRPFDFAVDPSRSVVAQYDPGMCAGRYFFHVDLSPDPLLSLRNQCQSARVALLTPVLRDAADFLVLWALDFCAKPQKRLFYLDDDSVVGVDYFDREVAFVFAEGESAIQDLTVLILDQVLVSGLGVGSFDLLFADDIFQVH